MTKIKVVLQLFIIVQNLDQYLLPEYTFTCLIKKLILIAKK